MKFLQKMPLYDFYTMVQKSQKWPKTQIKGGVLPGFAARDNFVGLLQGLCNRLVVITTLYLSSKRKPTR